MHPPGPKGWWSACECEPAAFRRCTARAILAYSTSRTFEPFDRFAQLEANRGRSLDELLAEFAALRRENLQSLDGLRLTSRQLPLEGRHPDFGVVTLRELLATWVVHDLGHIAQIARVMAGCYAGAVGPWGAYLPILERQSGRER